MMTTSHRDYRASLARFAASALFVASCATLAQCADAPATTEVPLESGSTLERFDTLMSQYMTQRGIQAAALGIMRNGAIVYQKGFGFRDSLHTSRVADTVVMRLASVTKPITAAAVRNLIAAGRLDIDARAFDVGQPGGGILKLAPFPSLGDPRIADITVRHLLQHRGGWNRDIAGDLTYREIDIAAGMALPSPPGRAATVRYILGQPLQAAPGATYAYSNIGYLVLGLIIEEVTGIDYLTFIHQSVFEPLGVARHDVIQGRTFPQVRDPREPWYDWVGTSVNVFDPSGPRVRAPDGGWHHEARIAQGGLLASTRALLRLAHAYQVSGDDIGVRRTGGEGTGWRRDHTGSLRGTNALIRQRGDGIDYVVLFNRSPVSGSYADEIRTQIDLLLDSNLIRWP